MAKQDVGTGLWSSIRARIDQNFTELYSGKEDAGVAAQLMSGVADIIAGKENAGVAQALVTALKGGSTLTIKQLEDLINALSPGGDLSGIQAQIDTIKGGSSETLATLKTAVTAALAAAQVAQEDINAAELLLANKVDKSGIKTIGGVSLLGSGDIPLPEGGGGSSLEVGTKTTYGAKGDAKLLLNAVVTAGSTTVTAVGAGFTQDDVGKVIAIPYAGALASSGGVAKPAQTHKTTIASVTNSTTIEMAVAAVRGVVGERAITDGAITVLTDTLTSATANFTIGDVGKKIIIPGAGTAKSGAGSPLEARITNYVSATQVTINRKALATVSAQSITIPGAWVQYGTDDTVALQAAIDASSAAKKRLILESGRYLTTAALVPKNYIYLSGEGRQKSIISPVGSKFSAIQYGNISSNPILDAVFESFEIDGFGVTVNDYETLNKGFYIRPLTRPIFRNLYVHDTSATGIGCDFMTDYQILNCISKNNGRQIKEFGGGEGGSGIGIGTGLYTEEVGVVSGNVCWDNGNRGIFTESQTATILSKGAKIVNNDCRWNVGAGIGDRACEGTIIEGNTVEHNGVGIETEQMLSSNALYSSNVIISNNRVANNAQHIKLRWRTGGAYLFNNIISNGTTIYSTGFSGIEAEFLDAGTGGELVVSGGSINNVRGSGIRVFGAGSLQNCSIDNVQVYDNGVSTSSRKAGISIALNVGKLSIRNNNVFETRAGAARMQSYGIAVTGGVIGFLDLRNNIVLDNFTGDYIYTGSTISARSENKGVANATGDGVIKTVTIPHLLGFTPSKFNVIPNNEVSAANYFVTVNATNIVVNYVTAPANAAALAFNWQAEI